MKLKFFFRILGFTSLLFFCFLIFLTICFYKVQNDAKLWVQTYQGQQELGRIEQTQSILLEKESSTAKDLFESFYVFFNQEQKLTDWYEENSTHYSIQKERLFFNDDISIKGSVYNDCADVYCFQKKISFANMPTSLWKGLIGIEDSSYLDHGGFSLRSIMRAMWVNLKKGRLAQGGSTLTQQLAKNLFLTNQKSFVRKFKEVVYSISIEKVLSKEEILSAYLNEVYWGSLQGIQIRGFFSAAIFYFSKMPQELSDFEVSILISMLKGPEFYHPFAHLEKLKERSRYIFKQLKEKKLFYEGQTEWDDKKFKKWVGLLERKKERGIFSALWALTSPSSSLMDVKAFNAYESFVFYTAVSWLKNQKKEQFKDEDIAVKAWVGDVFCLDCPAKFEYYSKWERKKQVALQEEKHLVGSTLKPLLYKIYLLLGEKLDNKVTTESMTLKLSSGEWTPKEASEEVETELTVEQALQKSRNIPTVRIAQRLGFDRVEAELKKEIPQLKPLAQYPAQLLGSIEMSTEEVAKLFKSFFLQECGWTQDLEQREVSVIYSLLDPKQTTLKNVVRSPLAESRFFGKTGTSDNGLDNWFVAFDGTELSVIWVGLEGSRQNKKLKSAGAVTSFNIYQDFVLNRGRKLKLFSCPTPP
ncbi:MAG: transglycosylase domain-containing protein [Bacteriovoracaceae bacterium]|nr:transglycosylase domain-containing protein [Bacteriovoracaceae bacterium]